MASGSGPHSRDWLNPGSFDLTDVDEHALRAGVQGLLPSFSQYTMPYDSPLAQAWTGLDTQPVSDVDVEPRCPNGGLACPMFQREVRMGRDRSCNGLDAKNMSDVRRHLSRYHVEFLELCKICNVHVLDQTEFVTSHGVRCANPQKQHRGKAAEGQWMSLAKQLFTAPAGVLRNQHRISISTTRRIPVSAGAEPQVREAAEASFDTQRSDLPSDSTIRSNSLQYNNDSSFGTAGRLGLEGPTAPWHPGSWYPTHAIEGFWPRSQDSPSAAGSPHIETHPAASPVPLRIIQA